MRYLSVFEGFKKVKMKKMKKQTKKVHFLSGVALIVDNRILMVNAKKYESFDNKWSIPKGHIEGDTLDSALKELREETGIRLDHKYDDMFEYRYEKSGFVKIMDIYVYRRDVSEFKDYLDGWDISTSRLDMNEISEASFLEMSDAHKKIDISMYDLLELI